MYTWTQLQLIPINQIKIQEDNYTCCQYDEVLHPQILIGEFKGITRIADCSHKKTTDVNLA